MRLENKVALISGGARGMGAAEARLFAREGAKVVIGDILEVEGRQLEAEISESGGDCLFVRLDVAKLNLKLLQEAHQSSSTNEPR